MKPLSGIKIIDLTRVLSGPYCTMTLADFGAEVIKIEPPQGDDTRQWGPPFVQNESAYYLSVNRNKKSMVLNLKKEKGKEIFLQLIKEADVVVENFRPGTLKKLGIDYDVLKLHNPRIILASISGFGQTGSYSQKPGYDILAQAMGGLMSVTGEQGGKPVKAGFSMGDVGAGMWAIIGLLAALYERNLSGKGQWVETSLLDTIVSWQTYLAGNYFASGEDPKPLADAHPNIVPYQAFQASDGYFILAVGNENLWNKFVETMGIENLKKTEYSTNNKRLENREMLVSLLNEVFQSKTVNEWISLFETAKIPCGPINKLSNILNDKHIHEREMVIERYHPILGSIKMLGIPVKFSRTPGEVESVPPQLGEHTNEILKDLGYSTQEISRVFEQKITAPEISSLVEK